MITADSVRKLVSSFPDPETGRPVGQLGQVGEVRVEGDRVHVGLGLTSWAAPIQDETLTRLRDRLVSELGIEESDCVVEALPHERKAEKLGQVGVTAKSVIAVGSGKGGVGKSTIATSIAYGLKNAGARVGLMDADVYGPSVPHLVGINERPTAINQRLQPIEKDGLKLISMGFMVPAEEAIVWRGPMLHGAVTQMLRDTDWGDLDYLVIDMPPGTGDIALTLSQLLPLTGAVVVCTPQDVALLDAVKAIAMFRKVSIPVLGVVENMSYFLCPDNGQRYDIFGNGGAKAKAAQLGVPFLGEAPISIDLRKRGDDGQTGGNYADDYIAPYLWNITRQMVRNIAASHAEKPATPSLPVL
ncbi:Mrp/NBP35 family ATP-binding protein [Botrimarina hoheduenensis]|uniref:Iron-sulfur cluster carrier protein n=1 Tax=Botrimarina hoheduenensis TaxID=2528000 RepID=A0A5C5WE70_9BACT|nr:Mrp/NBP35 family ATP-binding protein [Botrimarina hoheduenensis]TWT48361.1 Flagellum site-determining protein YlxH [Botrimarina hoheduenensis]